MDIKDRYGKFLGKIRINPNNGNQEILDPSGKVKGVYDPNTNKTKDPYGRVLGSGNLLSSLL